MQEIIELIHQALTHKLCKKNSGFMITISKIGDRERLVYVYVYSTYLLTEGIKLLAKRKRNIGLVIISPCSCVCLLHC